MAAGAGAGGGQAVGDALGHQRVFELGDEGEALVEHPAQAVEASIFRSSTTRSTPRSCSWADKVDEVLERAARAGPSLVTTN